ncbi:MAG TPA: hypothetical protein VFQ87_11480 [Bradyrhizobium sp.]|jgi:hypothetical protein|nr:hypothetical protein [Bradyrhizobium sp.]
MKNFCQAVAFIAALTGAACIGPAMAAPPTVVPSPGYDARLQEQRALNHAGQPPAVYSPAPRRKHRPHRAVTH